MKRVLCTILMSTAIVAACGESTVEPPPPLPATQLAFSVQPAGVAPNQPFSTALQVEIRNDEGGIVGDARDAVTMAIDNNPSGGQLSGTLTVNAISGVASFSGLSIDTEGTGYTLTASAGGLTDATSTGFDVAVGVAAQLAFRPLPPRAAGVTLGAVDVEIQDAWGNFVPSATNTVSLDLSNDPTNNALYANGLAGGGVRKLAYIDAVSGVESPALPSFPTGHIQGMTFDPVSGLVYAANFRHDINVDEHELSSIDPITGNQIIIGNTSPLAFRGFVMEPGTGSLLGVTNTGAGTGPPNELHSIDPSNAATTLLGAVTVTGDVVAGFTGLATDPTTGTIYAVVKLASLPGQTRTLATLDVASLSVTLIATLSTDRVAAIDFLSDGSMIAMTGTGGSSLGLYTVDKNTGGMTLVVVPVTNGLSGMAMTRVSGMAGTVTATAVGGVARFTSLKFLFATTDYVLQATSSGLTAGMTLPFEVTP